MRELKWYSESDFTIDGVSFHCAVGDYSGKTNRDRLLLLKDRGSLEQYATMFASHPPKNVLEFGIFQGGSPALFSLWFGVEKFVGIDICEPVPAFDEFCRTHPVGSKIRTYYRTSQTDRERVENIVQAEFGTTAIDAIIDDASHYYGHTRRTFEIAFPLLRPGGTYVIEDWGWAHWPHIHSHYAGQTPLSMLVMELLMLCASRCDLVSEIRIFPAFAFIRKSPQAQPVAPLQMDGLYSKRGIEIVGAQDLNLVGVAHLIASRVKHSVHRRLQRTRHKLQRAVRRARSQ